jgi:hypothetical protein
LYISWISTPEGRYISKKVVIMDMGYVSAEEFKKLEAKVNRILEAHSLDEKLTDEEKRLVKEAKKGIREKKDFVAVEEI